jgi:hypothetical protein
VTGPALVAAAPAPESVSPGIAGFLAIFALAIATVLLIRSMVGHLRKVRYSPDPAAQDEPEAQDAPDAQGAPHDPPGRDG